VSNEGSWQKKQLFHTPSLLPPSGKGKIIGNFSTFIQNGNLSTKIANFANQIYCAQAKVLHYQHVSVTTQRARLPQYVLNPLSYSYTYKIEGENPNLECPDLVRGRVSVKYGLPSLREESTQQGTGGTEPSTIWLKQHPCLEKQVCRWDVSAQALTVLTCRTEDLTSVHGYFCFAATKTEPIAPVTPAVNNILLVGLEEFSLFLKDFDLFGKKWHTATALKNSEMFV
jgi:hypothetical protein